MPKTTPTDAQRVARALQRAHARAEDERDQRAQHLRHLTEQHAQAVASLYDAHAEERALAAALTDAGGRTWREEVAAHEKAARIAQANDQAGPEATPTGVVAALARTLADPTSTAATRAAAAQAAQEAPPVPAPVAVGTLAAVDVLAGPIGRPREV